MFTLQTFLRKSNSKYFFAYKYLTVCSHYKHFFVKQFTRRNSCEKMVYVHTITFLHRKYFFAKNVSRRMFHFVFTLQNFLRKEIFANQICEDLFAPVHTSTENIYLRIFIREERFVGVNAA